jgi:hypothetical protein
MGFFFFFLRKYKSRNKYKRVRGLRSLIGFNTQEVGKKWEFLHRKE